MRLSPSEKDAKRKERFARLLGAVEKMMGSAYRDQRISCARDLRGICTRLVSVAREYPDPGLAKVVKATLAPILLLAKAWEDMPADSTLVAGPATMVKPPPQEES